MGIKPAPKRLPYKTMVALVVKKRTIDLQTYLQISLSVGISVRSVGEICRKHISPEIRETLFSRVCINAGGTFKNNNTKEREERDEDIVALKIAGWTWRKISEKHNLSISRVRKIYEDYKDEFGDIPDSQNFIKLVSSYV